jgi:hypothetical protein
MRGKLIAASLLVMASGPAAMAQPFTIDWYTIDGGGGTSTGGAFSLSGTIGQPDAGVMSGGTFTLTGGFWAGAVTPPPAGCSLADVVVDGTVDGSDFIAFINSFGIGDASIDPVADVAGGGPVGLSPDGTIDGTDFIEFINAFAIGC